MATALSLIVIEAGPERLIDRARAAAARLSSPLTETITIAAASMTPGAVRNAGVRRSTGSCFLIVDGSEQLPGDYAMDAVRALDVTPDASFAAGRGAPLFAAVAAGSGSGEAASSRLGSEALVGSSWALGSAVIRRTAFDDTGGFDESLPSLVDWDFLLTLTDAGRAGVLIGSSGSRDDRDDVRLRESLTVPVHLPALRRIFHKHERAFTTHMRETLVARERLAQALFQHERTLLERRATALNQLGTTLDELQKLRPALARHGLRSLDFADLRTTSPLSRNWGGDRGVPVDRHYIHEFIQAHAADVRGHVLEVLDAALTQQYGADRVERSHVLDIDPGNMQATVVADLRVAEQLPDRAYDCFILTQTLHLIDDMPAALATAYRALKPGGVLLATLPAASMVATEYGPKGDHWRVTESGARVLFERLFAPGDLTIRARGNVLTTTAFLHGLACEDIDPAEFAVDDPAYPLLITVRARKPANVVGSTRTTPTRHGAAVLRFHRIAELPSDIFELAVTPRGFRDQMEYLARHWHVVPLRELAAAVAAGDPPERAVALTFDDGYIDNLAIAVPILEELRLPATFFLTTEARRPNQRFWWDVLAEAFREDATTRNEWYAQFRKSPPVVRDDMLLRLARLTNVSLTSESDRPMAPDEVQRLLSCPLIEIGAHTVHHLWLPEVSPDECYREVLESRSTLERMTARSVTSFAYPFGMVSPDAVAAVTAAGFEVAVTCEGRSLRSREHPLRLPRLKTGEESGEELGTRLARICDL